MALKYSSLIAIREPRLLVEIWGKTWYEDGGLEQSIKLVNVIKFPYLRSLFEYDIWPMQLSLHCQAFPQYISVNGKEEIKLTSLSKSHEISSGCPWWKVMYKN